MTSEQDLIDSDYDSLSDSDIIVMLILDGDTSVSKTRLQKTSLLYRKLNKKTTDVTDFDVDLFGGYFDDIDESATNLTDMGILKEDRYGYSLTEYGRNLHRFILDEYDDMDQIKRIENIKSATALIPDRNLVGLSYHFYKEIAVSSAIRESVKKLNDRSSYDGIPLSEYNKADFESKLRSGTPISMERRRFR